MSSYCLKTGGEVRLADGSILAGCDLHVEADEIVIVYVKHYTKEEADFVPVGPKWEPMLRVEQGNGLKGKTDTGYDKLVFPQSACTISSALAAHIHKWYPYQAEELNFAGVTPS